MITKSLFEKHCPNKIPVKLGERIGGGSDGELFQVLDEPDKVIKLCVIYEWSLKPYYKYLEMEDTNPYYEYLAIREVIQYVLDNQTIPYVKIHAHQYVGSYSRQLYDKREQKFILHYYIMDRLNKISDEEYKVFYSILPHEQDEVRNNFSLEKAEDILQNLGRSFDIDCAKIFTFCKCIKESPVAHQDLHPRNVMSDNVGEYHLIDLDRCVLNINK